MVARRLDAIWNLITRIFWVVLFAACVAGFIALITPKYYRRNELSQRIHAIQEGNRELLTAIQRLEIRQQRFATDPAFVERTARELGMAKPGEIIYKYFADDTDER